MTLRDKLRRGTAAVGMLLLTAAVVPLSGCDSRAMLTPDDVIEGLQFYPETPATNPRSVTEEKCGELVPCKSAVMADELTVYKFANKDDAAAFAQALGQNGYQSDWIVLEYEGAANDTDPREATYAGAVDGMGSTDYGALLRTYRGDVPFRGTQTEVRRTHGRTPE